MPELFFTATRRIVGLLAASLFCSHANAGLSFGILDVCQPLHEAIRKLENGSATPRTCRPPRTDLERQYSARFTSRGQELCLLPAPPSPLFASFSCVQPQMINGAQIVCFRPASLIAVKAYKKNYGDRDATAEKRYLDAAAACPHSTGEAARAGPSLFPMVLGEIAAFELGFITATQPSGPTGTTVVHGYAETDPHLRGDIPSAIEFVSLSFSTRASAPAMDETETTRQVGDWLLRIDDDTGLEKEFDKIAHNLRAAMRVFSVSFSFEKRGSDTTGAEKARTLRSMKRTVTSHFRGEGFRLLSPETLARLTGISKSALFDMIRKHQPYNRRKMNVSDPFDFDMLMHEHPLACSPPNSGAIIVNVISTPAKIGVRSDHGSIGVMLMVVGKCALQSNLQRYATTLQTQAGAALIESLENNEE